MSMIQSDLLLGQEGGGGYAISRSLRFNSSDSAYLSRTPASAGNRKTFTISLWVKRCKLGVLQSFISSNNDTVFLFDANDKLCLYLGPGYVRVSTHVFRDVSAWYHLLLVVDTPSATAQNRVRMYVNNSEITVWDTNGTVTQNSDTTWNAALVHQIGANSTTQFPNQYIADFHNIDGQALTPSSFAETNATTGQWVPKAYTGSYGTNGFHLPFSDNSTAAALGTDTSGNGNNWTVNNLSVEAFASSGTTNISTVASSGFVAGGTTVEMVDSSTSTYYNALDGGIEFSSDVSGYFKTIQSRGASGNCWHEYYDASNSLIYTSPTTNISSGVVTTLGPYYVANVRKVIAKSNATGSGSDGHGIYAFYINNSLVNTNSNSATSFTFGAVLGAGNDSLVDTPTSYGTGNSGGEVRGNYCTWNPLANGAGALSNGNLDLGNSSPDTRCNSTISVSSGKWYYEILLNTLGTNSSAGIGQKQITYAWPGNDALSYAFELDNARTAQNGNLVAYGSALAAGDIFMCAFDLDNNKIFFGKNGTWFNSSNPATGTNPAFTLSAGSYCPIGRPYGGGSFSLNTGQRPFAYTAPSGFKALCDTNLPAPVVAQPSTVMDVKLYTGNGSTQTISGLGFSPDLVWLKCRNDAYGHRLLDTVRGATIGLVSQSTAAESTESTGLTAFNSDGFTLGSNVTYNESAKTYVGWTWDAGSSTVTNTQGSITSSVRANASAGFSVATLTTPSSGNFTVGHGLNVAPSLVICKARNQSFSWLVYHKSAGAGNYLVLNTTAASAASSIVWQNTDPSSTLVYGNASNWGTADYVMYSFAPVAGYSSFGSYTGNGSADGPFVYTGFRPRWVMIKASSASGSHWMLFDTARSTYNLSDDQLYANLSNAEIDANSALDFLANGFKCRADTFSNINGSGITYIYAAFAERPFQYARAR